MLLAAIRALRRVAVAVLEAVPNGNGARDARRVKYLRRVPGIGRCDAPAIVSLTDTPT